MKEQCTPTCISSLWLHEPTQFSNMFSLQDLLNSQMRSTTIHQPFAPQQILGSSLNTQLYVLMNVQLQHMLNSSLPRVDKVKNELEDNYEQNTYASSDVDATSYTLDALEVTDKRTKSSRRFANPRCVCDQCGKSYASTSNLSRHKQTHRPLDSEYAKQCPHCDRVYVSMPALRVICVRIPAKDHLDVLIAGRISLIEVISELIFSHILPLLCNPLTTTCADFGHDQSPPIILSTVKTGLVPIQRS
ncbi:hypothetical protein KIN20_006382 [Parelaphostrongylus tenuis]|uniref:C2H2-type domain-containing protein n=1 Tax=Parelaphostrongylus tenuis TaxID=148309 RepID=A0AAD5M5Z8_PARTN|nr:hypothetical protein KIN20_006382 [Parelaphostrongylus tenuis]